VNLSPQSPLARLLAAPVRPGEVAWIGLRAARLGPISSVSSAVLVAARGIGGDRYDSRHNGPRQVTMIASEDLSAIAAFLGRVDVAPELLRRNLVTRGINLIALKDRRFRVGPAVLEWSGECAPCSRMESNLGAGGYNAVRGRGGITARIVEGGKICVGDPIERIDPP
jgi:MOSC domain-containing protein YiiM